MGGKIAVIDRMKSGVRYIVTSAKKNAIYAKKGDPIIKRKGVVIGPTGPLGSHDLEYIISIAPDTKHYNLMSAILLQRAFENDRIVEAG